MIKYPNQDLVWGGRQTRREQGAGRVYRARRGMGRGVTAIILMTHCTILIHMAIYFHQDILEKSIVTL